MLSLGISPKVLSERLGHTSIAITLALYSHVIPTMQEEAASRFETLLAVFVDKRIDARGNNEIARASLG